MLANLSDSKIPQLSNALNCQVAQQKLSESLHKQVQLLSTQLIRHKLGRRALIAYQLKANDQEVTILGKIRAKGLDRQTFQLQQALWQNSFPANSLDGLSVPEPLGTIPTWHMWLQRQVPGLSVTKLLGTPAGLRMMPRVAELSHKLHHSGIQSSKKHTIADEISILRDRMSHLARCCPHWANRLDALFLKCDRLGQSISDLSLPETLIHRDYYGDQILVDGDRLWLVDLDLCCQSHIAIDLGNFIAHIMEHSLRYYGNLYQLKFWTDSFLKAYLDQYQKQACKISQVQHIDPDALHFAIKVYTYLTMVRHISISWQIPARQNWTECILEHCEQLVQQLEM